MGVTARLLATAAVVGVAVLGPRGSHAASDGCNGSGSWDTTDLSSGARIALSLDRLGVCPNLDRNADEGVTVDELVHAVGETSSTVPQAARAVALVSSTVPGVDIGSASGLPGQHVTFSVSLRTGGGSVAGMQNDISFDPLTIPVAATAGGAPKCTVNPTLNKSAFFAFRPSGCSGSTCTGMRALVLSLTDVDPMPDGAVLYSCQVNISSDAPFGIYPLVISNFILATPSGEKVPGVTGTDGEIAVGTALPTATPTVVPTPAGPGPCGNGIRNDGEDCDNGGLCVGGSNAGMACTSEAQCFGNGVCNNGTRDGTACATDSDCLGGTCRHCQTFGGDGCAANCTAETEVLVTLIPGVKQGSDLQAGTSGAVAHGAGLTVVMPLSGTEVLTIGKERDGRVPVLVKDHSAVFPKVAIGGLACACVRLASAKTCGGTLYEADGSRSPSCDTNFYGGITCPPNLPCTFAYGPGNAAVGVAACGPPDLEGVDVTTQWDAAGGQPVELASGFGPMGSAKLIVTAAVGFAVGSCPPDFCTDSDSIEARGDPVTLRLVTGSASTELLNANSQPGSNIGPYFVNGQPGECAALSLEPPTAGGIAFAGGFQALSTSPIGDIAVSLVLASNPTNPPTATLTQTYTPTPTATRPTATPTLPPGDCCLSGSRPTCDEPECESCVCDFDPYCCEVRWDWICADEGNDECADSCTCSSRPSPTPTPPLIRGNRGNPYTQRLGCLVEWEVVNPANPLDRRGLPKNRQVCQDGNPACDFQPESPGLCEFQVRVCLNNADHFLPRCVPNGIGEVEIVSPIPERVRQPRLQQTLADARNALNKAMNHLLDPVFPGDGYVYRIPLAPEQQSMCSEPFPVQVLIGGLRQRSAILKVHSRDEPGVRRETSSLKLICRSRPLP